MAQQQQSQQQQQQPPPCTCTGTSTGSAGGAVGGKGGSGVAGAECKEDECKCCLNCCKNCKQCKLCRGRRYCPKCSRKTAMLAFGLCVFIVLSIGFMGLIYIAIVPEAMDALEKYGIISHRTWNAPGPLPPIGSNNLS